MQRVLFAAVAIVALAGAASADIIRSDEYSFKIEHSVVVPGSPEEIYDAITGDISGWWDHTFSQSPARLYIDAKPGGAFLEIFDESGDGVRHAVVTWAERGKLLRLVGPLGLAGNAIHLVSTYQFSDAGPGTTRVQLTANAAGAVEEGWAQAVDGVWHHFLIEQFKPYIEAGKHKSKGTR